MLQLLLLPLVNYYYYYYYYNFKYYNDYNYTIHIHKHHQHYHHNSIFLLLYNTTHINNHSNSPQPFTIPPAHQPTSPPATFLTLPITAPIT
ncbi:hypothetical protein E2C01_060950 [Portunus trituberculatus]|uniref:Uncharacterized protein n=1 Tax=Portunus trituberculatus TaxID=210409 RepID=A0A5B7HBX0_PORTR|nr:hypothetical protein [Portunus trituberculatus]